MNDPRTKGLKWSCRLVNDKYIKAMPFYEFRVEYKPDQLGLGFAFWAQLDAVSFDRHSHPKVKVSNIIHGMKGAMLRHLEGHR